MKDYQKLVDECKKAYADNDLSKAWTLWEQINDILLTLDEFEEDDKVNRHFVWETYDKYMKQFTNEEVYGITDYGKRLAYRQMERERTLRPVYIHHAGDGGGLPAGGHRTLFLLSF